MRLVHCPSPNHDERPQGAQVDMLVLHYTGMETADAALARLCDPEAKVSAHYTIDRTGRIYVHVPEDRRAWHAGISYWAGERNINGRSIGIELVNPGHEFGYQPFPEAQIASLVSLAKDILSRHPIPPGRVLGHSDVAPLRKIDPGEFFPWARLAVDGVGLWPQISPAREVRVLSSGEISQLLERFGYGLPPHVEISLEVALMAFQRHFRPSLINGVPDTETVARLTALSGMI